VKASEDDLGWLYPGVPAEDAAIRWAARGPALVVVTRGADGAVAISRKATVSVPAPVVEVADTVGAGDTFAGAVLHGLDSGGLLGPGGAERIAALDADALGALLHRAATASALTCARSGATPPTADELEAALR
ncbi:MAG TPA: PfkB family carbohydrate kinase, partial [Cryptosporangiaceae bacterium]|nr:PfkB family carbohydrate kinase [Cryptosporangiaceae bacterium]